MIKEIDFYFDFISPYSYLAHKKIQNLFRNIRVNYKPILLGGLHNLEGIIAPAFNKSKLKHMISDCNLIANENNFEFTWNLKFPLNSLNIMRGYLYINPSIKNQYLNLMFDAYWKDNLDISNSKIMISLLNKCKVDVDKFFKGVANQKIKDELKTKTKEAQNNQIFGAPTFIVNNKVFWGQDRLKFALDEYNKH